LRVREPSSARANHYHDWNFQPSLRLPNRPDGRRQPAKKKRGAKFDPFCPTLFRLNRIVNPATTNFQQNL